MVCLVLSCLVLKGKPFCNVNADGKEREKCGWDVQCTESIFVCDFDRASSTWQLVDRVSYYCQLDFTSYNWQNISLKDPINSHFLLVISIILFKAAYTNIYTYQTQIWRRILAKAPFRVTESGKNISFLFRKTCDIQETDISKESRIMLSIFLVLNSGIIKFLPLLMNSL